MLAETAATVGNIAIPNTTNNVKFVIEFGMFAWMVVALFVLCLVGHAIMNGGNGGAKRYNKILAQLCMLVQCADGVSPTSRGPFLTP